MKKSLVLLALFGSLASLHAADAAPTEKKEAPATAEKETSAQNAEIGKISEAFGHLIGKNLDTIGLKFDIAQVIKGLEDASLGKTSPMSETECVQAIAAVQEKIFKDKCQTNLSKAEEFLAQNKKAADMVALEDGKVQYKIEQPGTGASVESHYSPLVRYKGKYLDGSVFGESKEEEAISLDEIIPGLKTGLVGMKEGEKRTIYIHPDMAYGTNGYLPPNSLLTFEIEVVKANAPKEETVESALEDAQKGKGSEIAETETHVR